MFYIVSVRLGTKTTFFLLNPLFSFAVVVVVVVVVIVVVAAPYGPEFRRFVM